MSEHICQGRRRCVVRLPWVSRRRHEAARTAVTRLVKAIDEMRNPSVDGDDCQHCGEGYCEDGCALCRLFTVRDALLDYPCSTVRAAGLDGEATG